MYAQGTWGEERNAWLASLSYGTAVVLLAAMLLIVAVVFRGPLLRLLIFPFRPLKPLWINLRVLLILTPLRRPLRRYLYVGRHLSLREA